MNGQSDENLLSVPEPGREPVRQAGKQETSCFPELYVI